MLKDHKSDKGSCLPRRVFILLYTSCIALFFGDRWLQSPLGIFVVNMDYSYLCPRNCVKGDEKCFRRGASLHQNINYDQYRIPGKSGPDYPRRACYVQRTFQEHSALCWFLSFTEHGTGGHIRSQQCGVGLYFFCCLGQRSCCCSH